MICGSIMSRWMLFMVLHLCRMCQWGLYAVVWSHIGILMRFPAAKPRSIAVLLFISQYIFWIFVTLCLMVWDWRVLKAVPMFFNRFQLFVFLRRPLLSINSFLFRGWYCGAGVFGLIGWQWLSPGLELPTFSNISNNNNYYYYYLSLCSIVN